MSLNLKIKVQVGSPKMVEKGIMGRATVFVAKDAESEPVFGLNNFLIRKNKDGELWVASPSESFKIQTESGEETRWKAIVKVGPNEKAKDGPIQTKFQKLVLDKYREELEAAKANQTATTPEPATAPADPGDATPDF